MGQDLITLSEYKAYAEIRSTNNDALINILIPKISEYIKNYCRRSFVDYVYDSKVEIFSGNDIYFMPEETPVIAVASVEFSADYGQTYTALTEFVDWVLDGNLIRPIQSEYFAKQLRGYRVTYTAGYECIPDDLKLAIMDLITYYRKNDGTVNATKFTNTTTMQIEYISDAALPAYIRRVLDYYIADYY